MLTILYFAWVREAIGLAEERLVAPPEIATVAEAIAWLAGRGPGHAALDQRFVGPDAAIAGARELALFPPVTGG